MAHKTLATPQPTYQALHQRLQEVLAALQSPDTQVDEALELYKKGTELLEQLEAQLASARLELTSLPLDTSEGQ